MEAENSGPTVAYTLPIGTYKFGNKSFTTNVFLVSMEDCASWPAKPVPDHHSPVPAFILAWNK